MRVRVSSRPSKESSYFPVSSTRMYTSRLTLARSSSVRPNVRLPLFKPFPNCIRLQFTSLSFSPVGSRGMHKRERINFPSLYIILRVFRDDEAADKRAYIFRKTFPVPRHIFSARREMGVKRKYERPADTFLFSSPSLRKIQPFSFSERITSTGRRCVVINIVLA